MTEVRVRIAPSPTGDPHVGTAYIALFNYAFARANQGKFILRIEDTDRTRSRPEYETNILKALKWVGLNWDEGPDVGGDYGPYRQSERTEIYRQHVEKLLIKGGAYRCFCTAERLQKMREEQRKRKLSPQYDGKCRHMSESTVGKKLKEKIPYVIRLKVPRRGKCILEDRFRDKITFPYKEVDDQILLKSDGFPTYHLANVIDDHLMNISHVIRGEEWLSSAPKHILLYDFFGWNKPEFIHMPLLLNEDGSKLSKRKNPTSIFFYRDAGYLPQALANYIGLMGYSRPNGEEKFSIAEMIEDFDIDRISLGGSVFDMQKLNWLSGKYIREDLTPEQLLKQLVDWRLNGDIFSAIIPDIQKRLDTLGDFIPLCSFLWSRELEYDENKLIPRGRSSLDSIKTLQSLLFTFDEEADWNAATLEKNIREVSAVWEWKIRDLTGMLFVAITGKKVAPPLFTSMMLLGKNLCRVRLIEAIKKLGGISKKKQEALVKEWTERRRNLELNAE